MASTMTAASGFYIWEFPGAPFKVHLHFLVVQSLRQRLWEAGAGVFQQGLLYGRLRGEAVEVLDFQPAPKGWTPNILAALTPEKRRRLVGYYRTEEGKALRLEPKDLALADEWFSEPHHLFLTIRHDRTGPPRATFFLRDANRRMIDTAASEFPFDSSLLASGERGPIPQPRTAAATRPAPAPRHSSGFPVKTFAVASFAAMVAASGVFSHGGALRQWYSHTSAAASALPPRPVPNRPQPQPSMALRATRQNGDLQITWDRASAPIAASRSGAIAIQDGASNRSLPLTPAELRDGSLLYSPTSDQVTVQLTVTTPAGSITESVMALLPKRGAAPASAIPPPLPANAPAPRPKPAAPPAVPSVASQEAAAPPASTADYEPPVAISKVLPEVPLQLQHFVVTRTTVRVRITIDETGRVVEAHAVPQPAVNERLLALAESAARSWRFEPARRNHQAVSARMVATFVFNP